MRAAYERELATYIARHRHRLTRWLGINGGTASNAIGGTGWLLAGAASILVWIPQAAAEMAGWQSQMLDSAQESLQDTMKDALRTGCLDLQAQTYAALNQNPVRGWDIKDWMVGNFLEHHAINVHRENEDGTQGWIFDPWITLSPQVYPFSEWKAHFSKLSWLGDTRAEW